MPKKSGKKKKSQRKSSKKGRKANGQFKKGHKLNLRAKATAIAYKRRNRRRLGRLATSTSPRETKQQAWKAGAYLANKAKEYLHELNELQKYQDYINSRSQIFQPGFFA